MTRTQHGASQTIFLGWVNINQERMLFISLSYKQKTIVDGIIFKDDAGTPIQESTALGKQLKDVVAKAILRRNNPEKKFLQVEVSSLYKSIAPYSSTWFEIIPKSHPISLVRVKVRAFDKEDAQTELLRIIQYILDILCVETGSPFWISQTESTHDGAPEKVNDYPKLNTFVKDERWIDLVPDCDGYLLISSQAMQFIDRIISKDELSSDENTFLHSCHHYHVAREQDALVYNRLYFSRQQEDEHGSVSPVYEEDTRITSAQMFSRRSEELATVLYMSAIEVASKIDFDSSGTCKACGQIQYKISARVSDYIREFLESEGNPLFKAIKDHYTKRSQYLHEGTVLIDHSYTGTTIPKLDPSSDCGVSQNRSASVEILRFWIGDMLRQHLKRM